VKMSLKHEINQKGERNKSFFDRPRCCERHAAEMRIDKKGNSPVCSNSQTEVEVRIRGKTRDAVTNVNNVRSCTLWCSPQRKPRATTKELGRAPPDKRPVSPSDTREAAPLNIKKSSESMYPKENHEKCERRKSAVAAARI
jgi:hypothetical protein